VGCQDGPVAKHSALGRVVLVSGPEALLAERAVNDLLSRVRAEEPAVEVAEVEASRLDGMRLDEMTSPSLFSTSRAAVIVDLANLPAELVDRVSALAAAPLEDLALILVHGGGVKGKALLDRLKKSKVDVIDCPSPKAWELPQFVSAEARRVGGSIESAVSSQLVDAVGHDLRMLASAVSQLVADAADGHITAEQIRHYFAGRSEVTSFAVADAALSGRTGLAMEQLRWAMATGVAPVLVTSAMAAGLRGLGKLVTAPSGLRETDLAQQVGVPPWKLKSMRGQVRGWDAGGIAAALKTVALADADVKGAAEDAEFALERMVIAVAQARRG
jgi:DNA polymerase III subunit delta